MLKIITNPVEIVKYQKVFENSLHDNLPSSVEHEIGFPSGSWVAPIYYNKNIWYSTYLIEGKRNWNGFGVTEDLQNKKAVNIIVEINTPLDGINKRVSGFFAQDSNNEKVYLLHRGKIGGGRKGIGKNAFLQWYSKDLTIAFDENESENPALLIGDINSKKLVTNLSHFIKSVMEFKDLVTTGDIDESTYIPDKELLELAKHNQGKPKKNKSTSKSFNRNIYVSEYAKRRANGNCQLCEFPAPFKNAIGRPYLETHHVTWLSHGGLDVIDNTVALCPNCHRKMHIVNLKKDTIMLQNIAKQS